MQDMTKSWFDTIRYEMNIRIQDGFPPFEDHVRIDEIREPGVVFQDERVKVTSAVVHHPPIAPAFVPSIKMDSLWTHPGDEGQRYASLLWYRDPEHLRARQHDIGGGRSNCGKSAGGASLATALHAVDANGAARGGASLQD